MIAFDANGSVNSKGWVTCCHQNVTPFAVRKIVIDSHCWVISAVNNKQPWVVKTREPVLRCIDVWLDPTNSSNLTIGVGCSVARARVNPEHTPEAFSIVLCKFAGELRLARAP